MVESDAIDGLISSGSWEEVPDRLDDMGRKARLLPPQQTPRTQPLAARAGEADHPEQRPRGGPERPVRRGGALAHGGVAEVGQEVEDEEAILGFKT